MTDTRIMVAQRLDRGLRPNVISLLLFITNINCIFALRIKAFFSIMQNKTDKKTSLVSKSLPIANSNYVNCLFSARKKKYYDLSSGRLFSSLFQHRQSTFSMGGVSLLG